MAAPNSPRLLIAVSMLLTHLCVTFCGAGLRGGAAKTDITPPVGVWLSGYGFRDKPSDAVADPLHARTLVLHDGRTSIALISCDLLWVPLEITNRVRSSIAEQTGIPRDHVLICGTHTHFGPKTFDKTSIGPRVAANAVNLEYVRALENKIVESAIRAHEKLTPVTVGASRGYLPDVVFNRRPVRPDGSVKTTFSLSADTVATREIATDPNGFTVVNFAAPDNSPELIFGPVDPDVWALAVKNKRGQTVGSLVNYACHAVSGSRHPDWSYAISADFPGVASAAIESRWGGISLFTAGTCGDIVPLTRGRDSRPGIGKAVAAEVLEQLRNIQTVSDISLDAACRRIDLPLKSSLPSNRIIDADGQKERLTTEIQVLRVGRTYILGLPGEILVEIGLQIKKVAGVDNLIIISLANDACGYVCTRRAYSQGGYEPGQGTNLAPGAGEIMLDQSLDLIHKVAIAAKPQ